MSKELIEGVDYKVHAPASKKQEMIIKSDAQILVIGGAMGGGKTYLQQMIALRYIDDPNTAIVTFRRTTDEIFGQGGVYDTAEEIWGSIHPSQRPRFTRSQKRAVFPSGATATFKHMEYAKDVKKQQGLQFTICNFDEGTTFEFGMIEYMFQRMRSKSKYKSRIIISCNPDPDHRLAELIEWYLDEAGYPDPEKEGKIRYFVRQGGEFNWGATREELGIKFDIPEDKWETSILSFSFIGCKLTDNPPMMKASPEYLAFLEGMNDIDKARNLHGNWKVRPVGSNYFERGWLHRIDKIPLNSTCCRGWDKASTQPSDITRYPDYTTSVKMYKTRDGTFVIVGNFCPSNREDDENIGRFRKRAGERDLIIQKQAEYDGSEVVVVFPVDPGAAGKTEYTESSKKLIVEGFKVKPDPMPTNKGKLTKFTPFSSAAENGLVSIVESTFPDKATLEHFYKELESFDGERSTALRKDDIPDACASAFNYLCKSRVYKTPIVAPQGSPDTLAAPLLSDYTTSSINDLPKVEPIDSPSRGNSLVDDSMLNHHQ